LAGFGAKAYVNLGVQTDVLNADPHRLVLILFDGALYAIQRAKGFLASGSIAQKCQALSQACEIVDNGLRVSVDPSHDRQFATRLISLYNYVTMRLLQANLRNDPKALDEAAQILSGLRGAWVQIAPSKPGAPVGATSVTAQPTAPPAAEPASSRARRIQSAYQL
jgi:flagellar protein FliS